MKIAFFEISKDEQAIFKDSLKDHSLSFCEDKLSLENLSLAKDAEVVSIFINSEVKKELVDALPDLKLITTRSTGFDHIDVEYAKSKGIKISNVPSYGAHTVAEFTFALILTLSRKVYGAYNQLREGCDFNISGLRGFDLFGKTLGVIGMGKIGKNVIRIAKGFGMNTIAYDIKPDMNFAKETCTDCVSLDDIFSKSDIVTIHTFYDKKTTHHLLNKENMSKMKRGAYLINSARGEIVDTSALVELITKGHLAGAGLDVLESERQLREEAELMKDGGQSIKDFKTLYEDHLLIDFPNVIVTPHIAFFTKEAEEEIMNVTAKNILSFVSGVGENLL